jgi:hypothetical protein
MPLPPSTGGPACRRIRRKQRGSWPPLRSLITDAGRVAIALFNGQASPATTRGGGAVGQAAQEQPTAKPPCQHSCDQARRERQCGQAIKWHIVAKAGGVSDPPFDVFAQKQSPEVRTAAEKAAKPWLDAIKEARESRS